MSVSDIEMDEPTVREDELWVDRTDEARELADFILNASDGLVVLYGRFSVGKTTLIKRYVMRVLPDEYERRFEDAAVAIELGLDTDKGRLSLQQALESKSIIFLDRFERYLSTCEDGGASLESMSEFLRSSKRQGILILVMDDAGLEKVLSAAAYLPQLLSATREIQGVDIRQGFRTLLENEQSGALEYDDEFLERLCSDTRRLTQAGGGCGPDLLMALVEELRNRSEETDGGRLTVALYDEAGHIDGLLTLYMEHRITAMYPNDASARRNATALLMEIAEHDGRLAERSLNDVSARLGESYEECVKIQDRLIAKSRLFSTTKNRPLQFVPSELRRVIGRLARPSEKVQTAYETVEQGYDAWQRLGSPLPRDRFEQVHGVRKELLLHQGFIEFLVYSIPEDKERIFESRYWLRRLRDAEQRKKLLRTWLYSEKEELRLRAAGLGTEFPTAHQVNVLTDLAMTDASPEVRSRALAVLMEIEGPEPLRARLERDVQSGELRIRERALEALRLFPDERNREFIRRQALSKDQTESLRGVAVETLAALELPGAVDDLRHMAMQSPDPRVRERATQALATLRSKDAYEHLFTSIRETPSKVVDDAPPLGLKGAVGVVLKSALVGILLIANFWLHGLLLFVSRRWVVGTLVFAIEGLAIWAFGEIDTYDLLGPILIIFSLGLGYVLPLGTLLRARSRFELPRGSVQSILCVVLFFINLPIFLLTHGLANLLLGRVGRAAALLAAEIAALGAFAVVFYLKPMFYIAGWSELTKMVPIGYLSVGAILFIFSFALDWGVVAVRHVVFFRSVEGKRRRNMLLRAVLATPLAAETITDWAQGTDAVNRKWARGVLLEHAEQVPHEELVHLLESENPETQKFAIKSLARSKNDDLVRELTERWEKARPQTSIAIRKIMSMKPTEASVKAFREWKRGQGFREDLRYRMTRARFRYIYWPKSLMVAATLGLPLLMLLTYHAVLSYRTEASPLVTFIIRNDDAGIELRVTVANFVADKYPDAELTPLPRAKVSKAIQENAPGPQQTFEFLKRGAEQLIADEAQDDDPPRTVFDELIHVQGNTNSCYVEIGLVQSLGIAVFRLEQKGALADRLTTAKKRDIFEKPLRDIKEQLTLEDCYPDSEKEEALYRDWTTNGNKGTIKALQALNTVVREVPEVFTGRSDQVRSLAGELQKMINQRDRYNESNALRALAGIYLLHDDIDVEWGRIVEAELQGTANTSLEKARQRFVKNGENGADLDIGSIQSRAAAAFAALGTELYTDAQKEENTEDRPALESEALGYLDHAFALDNAMLDSEARSTMRALRNQQNLPR